MATAELLAEDDVTASNLFGLFKRAFMKTTLGSDGALVVHSDRSVVLVTIDEGNKLLRFMSIFGLNESSADELKHALVNKMNADVIFVCFSISRTGVLVADYHLLFEEGILEFQVVATLRLFARVVPEAVRIYDENDIVK